MMAARQSSGEVPVTASHGCLNQARYELQRVATVLPKHREEDEEVMVVVGRGELHSGEAWPRIQRRKNSHCPSPKARMARLGGR